MAKIIHIAILVEDDARETIYNTLADALNPITKIKDYAFNSNWQDYRVDRKYKTGSFVKALHDIL